ncbi:MAG: hypothetical protein ONB05_05840, partial [candidate division KSB1 bacterium]|nr:hypothetical protein [candidate division KSB1 bacterium]
IAQDREGNVWFGTAKGGCQFNGVDFKDNGLPTDTVYSILLDRKGNLWFGTASHGIAKLENSRITMYNTSNGLPDNHIFCIFQDSQNKIWLGTIHAVVQYDGQTFHTYEHNMGSVNRIVEDRQQTLWLTSQRGVSRYTGTIFQNFTTAHGLPNNTVLSACIDATGIFWVGTASGLARFDSVRFRVDELPGELRREKIYDIFCDRRGYLWFATDDSLIEYSREDNYVKKHAPPDRLSSYLTSCVFQDSEGNLWLGTRYGVWRYTPFLFRSVKSDLLNEDVYCIYEDRAGNLWFGLKEGAIRYDGMQLRFFSEKDGLNARWIYAVLQDDRGNLWFGTGNSGLFMFDGQSFRHFSTQQGLASNAVNSIIEDARRNLWFGTFAGISKYDYQRFENFSTEDGLPSNEVYSLYQDRKGEIWIGTDANVSRFDGQNFRSYQLGSGAGLVSIILEDRKGNLWLGTWDGLRKFNQAGFDVVKAGLGSNKVQSIVQDGWENLWIATLGGGVSKYDGRKFENYSISSGLVSNHIHCAFRDQEGHLWFGMTRGVVQYDPVSPRVQVRPSYYISQNNSARFHFAADDGKFGTNPQEILFSHQLIPPQGQTKPKWSPFLKTSTVSYSALSRGLYTIRIQAIDGQGNKSTTMDSTFVIKSLVAESPGVQLTTTLPDTIGHGKVVIEYEGSDNITSSSGLQYEYHLLPLEMDWKKTTNTKVSYEELKPGKYTFQVRAIDEDGFVTLHPAQKSFVVAFAEEPQVFFTTQFPDTVRKPEVTFRYRGLDDETPSNRLLFSHRLLGKETQWNPFARDTIAFYTNLKSGTYTFQVKARDEAGHVSSNPAEISFYVDLKENPSIRITNTIGQNIDKNEATFHFVGTDAKSPQNLLRYSYRLSPIETIWSPWVPDTTKTYLGLKSGKNYIFQVKAQDEDEYESQIAETSFYIRPFWRRAKFVRWSSVLGSVLIVLISSVVFGVRTYQRIQAIKTRFNPYVVGLPVWGEKQFFDREEEMRTVLGALEKASVLITGRWRSGKTSFQRNLTTTLMKDKNPRYKFFPVFIDLQGVIEDKFFGHLFEITEKELSRLSHDKKEFNFLKDKNSCDEFDVAEALSKSISILQEKEQRTVILVLQIDEINELYNYGELTKTQFRRLFLDVENLRAVLTGFDLQKEKQKYERSLTSPWWNIFQEMTLKEFDEASARQLILQPAKGIYKFQPGVPEEIIRLSENKPFLIQRLCWFAVNFILNEGRREITLADVHSIANEALAVKKEM